MDTYTKRQQSIAKMQDELGCRLKTMIQELVTNNGPVHEKGNPLRIPPSKRALQEAVWRHPTLRHVSPAELEWRLPILLNSWKSKFALAAKKLQQ